MNMMLSQTARSPKKILIVTGDCPSRKNKRFHIYLQIYLCWIHKKEGISNANDTIAISSYTDPYACAKLATVLADSGHDVTLAGPNGQALSRLQAEAQRYHESTSTKNKIGCISIVSIIDVYLSTLLPLIH